ncbi:MAG: pentapeptide repeat-containing protein [Chloroflexi bacterium]|nr:pentapeptide repeat-containing protein [Chloroflexota bacterium]
MNEENRKVITQENLKDIIQRIKDGEDVDDNELTDKVFESDFVLNGVEVQHPISFENSHFMGLVDLSHATFKKVVNFKNVTFEADALFVSLMLERDIYLDRATFKGRADFSNLTAQGAFHSRSVTFKQNATFSGSHFHKSVNFESCHFEGEIDFHGATEISGDAIFNRAKFDQRADFYGATIRGMALFSFTKFKDLAKFTAIAINNDTEFIGAVFEGIAHFDDIRLGGDAIFWSADFNQGAYFGSARVTGNGLFPGARFNMCDGKTNFNSAQIGGRWFCGTASDSDITSMLTRISRTIDLTNEESEIIQRGRKPVIFKGKVTFAVAQFGGQAVFVGATFEQEANFNSVRIDEHAYFRTEDKGNRTTFKGTVNFVAAYVGGGIDFKGTVFKEKANFSSMHVSGNALFQTDHKGNVTSFHDEVDFMAAHIGGRGDFRDVRFKQQTSFKGVNFDLDICLEDAYFEKDLDFSSVSCSGMLVLSDGTAFNGRVDLRNSTYDSIEPIDLWEKLLDHLEPYDRQPFTQLEQTLRRTGEDRLADRVYYIGQRRHSKTIRLWPTFLPKLFNFLYFILTGYGVRPLLLLGWITGFLLGGTIFFHYVDEAIVTGVDSSQISEPVSVSCPQAFGFAVKHFLPIEIPFGEGWVPSPESVVLGLPSTFFATILTICGWILVPLAIAVIPGALKRE